MAMGISDQTPVVRRGVGGRRAESGMVPAGRLSVDPTRSRNLEDKDHTITDRLLWELKVLSHHHSLFLS